MVGNVAGELGIVAELIVDVGLGRVLDIVVVVAGLRIGGVLDIVVVIVGLQVIVVAPPRAVVAKY